MSVNQAVAVIMFICGATLAGLAAIHFVWLNPAVIGPLALPIGMTPLVLLFEYSFEIAGRFFVPGAVVAMTTWLLLRRNPPRFPVARAVLISGAALIFVSLVVFVGASVYYNVGMAGETPAGWHRWVRPGCRAGELGLVLFLVGLLLVGATGSGRGSRGLEARKSRVC